MERIGGMCWEWGAIGLLGVALAVFLAWEMTGKRRVGAKAAITVVQEPKPAQRPKKRRKEQG